MAKPQIINTRQWYQKEDSYCIIFNKRWGSSVDKLQDFYLDTFCDQESKTPWGISKSRKFEPEEYDKKKHKGKVCKECIKQFKIFSLKSGVQK